MFLKTLNFFNLYFSKKLFFVFLMGISSGIPLYLTLSTLIIWLTRENLDLSTIGLFTLTQLPWSLKFLWAPFLDYYKVPFLSKKMGRRKSWLIVIQLCLFTSIILLGFNDPIQNLFYTALFALFVSFFSASQDIVIDAYRIEVLSEKLQGAGAAMTQAGYRVGGILAGAGALYLKEILPWNLVFLTIAIIILIFMILISFSPREKNYTKIEAKKRTNLFISPFKEFFFREKVINVLLIMSFILFFKLGDVVAGVMANPFYVKLGFSNIEIANASKIFGVIATLIGVFLGGWMVNKIGIIFSLIVSGILQIISNLLFYILSFLGPDYIFLLVTVFGENISGGLGSAAFVAYLSILCNKKYTASQYALLSSIMGIARTLLSSPAGFLVEIFGWSTFFLISMIFGIPGLILLFWMIRYLPLNKQVSRV